MRARGPALKAGIVTGMLCSAALPSRKALNPVRPLRLLGAGKTLVSTQVGRNSVLTLGSTFWLCKQVGTCSEREETNGFFELLVLKTVPHKLKNNFLTCTMPGANSFMVRKEAPVSAVQPKPGMVGRQGGQGTVLGVCWHMVLTGDVLYIHGDAMWSSLRKNSSYFRNKLPPSSSSRRTSSRWWAC